MENIRNILWTPEKLETAAEKMTSIFQHIDKFGYFVGADTKYDWKMNIRSKYTLLLICILMWLECYTTAVVFPSLKCAELIAGAAVIGMSFAKFQGYMFHFKKFLSIKRFMVNVYEETVSGNREFILTTMTHTIISHCHLVLFGIFFAMAVYSCYPCYDFLFNGKLTLVSPLLMPFVDETTINGYFILLIFNIFAAGIGVCGNYYFSTLFVAFVDFYDGLVSLVEDDFEIFDGMWEKKRDQPRETERMAVFRNLMMELMDLARYNPSMNDLFDDCSTVQVISSYYGTVALLFAYFATGYIGGIGGCVFFLTDLFMCCSIGQMLENTNERILLVIYNSKWYSYDTVYQKDILFALNIFQNVTPIRVASLYPLNFETGLQVVNNIYSALMVMLNFLE